MIDLDSKETALTGLQLLEEPEFRRGVNKVMVHAWKIALSARASTPRTTLQAVEASLEARGLSQAWRQRLEDEMETTNMHGPTGGGAGASGALQRPGTETGLSFFAALQQLNIAVDPALHGMDDGALARHLQEDLQVITETQATRAWALVHDLEFVDLRGSQPRPEVQGKIDSATIISQQMLPWRLDVLPGREVFVTVHPDIMLARIARAWVINQTGYGKEPGRDWKPALAAPSALRAYIEREYGDRDVQRRAQTVVASDTRALATVQATDRSNPVVDIVERAVRRAVADGASDIHLEMTAEGTYIRTRVDGRLVNLGHPIAPDLMHNVLAVVKQLSQMDEAERGVGQDAALQMEGVSLRVSSMPTSDGLENVTMRILRDAETLPTLDEMDLSGKNLAHLRSITSRLSGMLITTGPTGSGKSTTNYAMVIEVSDEARKTITIEDPVEYRLKGRGAPSQVQVSRDGRWGFAAALRTALRQDPDTIMVGEIRDFETANIALEAANTGHLVLTTLHTLSAPSAISRLRHMGLQPYSIEAGVAGVLAQRLIPRVCSKCAEPEPIDERTCRSLGLPPGSQHWVGRGCSSCQESGLRGRIAVHEMMPMTRELREAVIRDAGTMELNTLARSQGMHTLAEDAGAKVARGLAPLSAAVRLLSEEDAAIKGDLQGEPA